MKAQNYVSNSVSYNTALVAYWMLSQVWNNVSRHKENNYLFIFFKKNKLFMALLLN